MRFPFASCPRLSTFSSTIALQLRYLGSTYSWQPRAGTLFASSRVLVGRTIDVGALGAGGAILEAAARASCPRPTAHHRTVASLLPPLPATSDSPSSTWGGRLPRLGNDSCKHGCKGGGKTQVPCDSAKTFWSDMVGYLWQTISKQSPSWTSTIGSQWAPQPMSSPLQRQSGHVPSGWREIRIRELLQEPLEGADVVRGKSPDNPRTDTHGL